MIIQPRTLGHRIDRSSPWGRGMAAGWFLLEGAAAGLRHIADSASPRRLVAGSGVTASMWGLTADGRRIFKPDGTTSADYSLVYPCIKGPPFTFVARVYPTASAGASVFLGLSQGTSVSYVARMGHKGAGSFQGLRLEVRNNGGTEGAADWLALNTGSISGQENKWYTLVASMWGQYSTYAKLWWRRDDQTSVSSDTEAGAFAATFPAVDRESVCGFGSTQAWKGWIEYAAIYTFAFDDALATELCSRPERIYEAFERPVHAGAAWPPSRFTIEGGGLVMHPGMDGGMRA